MYTGNNDAGIDRAMAKHAVIYGARESQRIDWDDYIASYPEPWVPAYYLRGLDDEPGKPAYGETWTVESGTAKHFGVLARRRAGKGAPGPLGRLIVSVNGLAIESEPAGQDPLHAE